MPAKPAAFALVALCLAAPAFAESFTLMGEGSIDLKDLSLTGSADAELRIHPMRIDATYGIKLEDSGQQFASAAPVVIKRPFIVRDANGAEFRFWVHAAEGRSRWVEVVKIDKVAETNHPTRIGATFRVSSFLIDGLMAESKERELKLNPDGTWKLGGASGKWSGDDRSIFLDGVYAEWGRGDIDRSGTTLSFQFARGALPYSVVMSRVTPPGSEMAQAASR
jgi:hypothetical protein